MLHPRAGAGAAGLVNELYVIGGGRDSDSAAPFGESYDPTTGKWALVNTPMLSDEPSWSDLGVTNIETRLFALGGYRGQETPVTDAFVYAPLVYQTFIPAASSGGE
jgi:hypothetical protein